MSNVTRKRGQENHRKGRKGDERKALVALAIKRETPMNLDWIAKRLGMGAPSGVSRRTVQLSKQLEGTGQRHLKTAYRELTRKNAK